MWASAVRVFRSRKLMSVVIAPRANVYWNSRQTGDQTNMLADIRNRFSAPVFRLPIHSGGVNEVENRQMPATPKKHQQVREKILDNASRLFNRRGFGAVSIDDVMAEAGLTRGSFYTYFSSKADLYAQSVARIVCEKRDAAAGPSTDRMSAEGIIRDYLSVRHFDDIDGGCPMIGLPSDISRTDDAVRQAFEQALRLMVEIFDEDIGSRAQPKGDRALAIAALCVGGMVLARSVADRELADRTREAALAAALKLGKWAQ